MWTSNKARGCSVPLQSPTSCSVCGYPVAQDATCNSCRVRNEAGLPSDANCGTCNYHTRMRCALMGKHGVCSTWTRTA